MEERSGVFTPCFASTWCGAQTIKFHPYYVTLSLTRTDTGLLLSFLRKSEYPVQFVVMLLTSKLMNLSKRHIVSCLCLQT